MTAVTDSNSETDVIRLNCGEKAEPQPLEAKFEEKSVLPNAEQESV